VVGVGRRLKTSFQGEDRGHEQLLDPGRAWESKGRTTSRKAKADAAQAAREAALVMPDTLRVAIGELAGELGEGLAAFVVGAGLKVVQTMMAAEVEALVGPRGRHDPACRAVRHGTDTGLVSLGGPSLSPARRARRRHRGAPT